MVVPQKRPAAKNHNRLAMSGPPKAALASYTFFTLLTDVSPWLIKSSSRLSLCRPLLVPARNNEPEKLFEPLLGMLLT